MPPTTHSDSDFEDDSDYVPPADEHDSDSADELDKGDDDIDKSARPETDAAELKKRRDALWASFQVSVSAPPSGSGNGNGNGNANENGDVDGSRPPPAKRIRIEKTFLFAGKHVTEVVEVPEDSEEAKKWPRWTPTPRESGPPMTSGSGSTSSSVHVPPAVSPPSLGFGAGEASSATTLPRDESGSRDRADHPMPPAASPTTPQAPPVADSSSATPPPPPTTTTTTSATPNTKRPGPRKPRTALPSLPSKAQHAKKITTLDKSAMDWRAHVTSQPGNVKDELDANRRGGGYLEKVDFLQRVQDRREDAFEASKSSKRRRA